MKSIETAKILVRKWLPSRHGFSGNFSSWNEAAAMATGYQAAPILDKVKTAVLKVKRGEAVYERDSVLFNEVEYSWPLLATLNWIAAQNNGGLKVVDFGGSLGSSYFQNRKFLEPLDIKWNVIEQENFVKAGRDEIQDTIKC